MVNINSRLAQLSFENNQALDHLKKLYDDEVARLGKQIESMAKTIGERNDEVAKLKEALENAQDHAAIMQHERDEGVKKIKSLDDKRLLSGQKNKKLSEANATLTTRLPEIETDLTYAVSALGQDEDSFAYMKLQELQTKIKSIKEPTNAK